MAQLKLVAFSLLLLLLSDFSTGAPFQALNSDLSGAMSNPKDDVNDVFQFFPDTRNDGLNLHWGHAINSWELLNKTLSNETTDRVHMIEADVIIRQKPVDDEDIPVMGHPPATDSNLTFHDWLRSINEFRATTSAGETMRVGAKADFKSLRAARAALKLVKDYRGNLTVPVWLNADIARGPNGGGSAVPVDADQFLRSCTDYGPGLTLSLGWTTPPSVELIRCNQGYGWGQVVDMYKKIAPFIKENVSTSNPPRITFAIRAALVKPSLHQLLWLLDCAVQTAGGQYRDRFTITLWTVAAADRLSQDDYLAINKLRSVLGKNRVFIDLPSLDVDCLKNESMVQSYNTSNVFDPQLWQSDQIGSSIVFNERSAIVLLGQTETKLKMARSVRGHVKLNCRFVFVPANVDPVNQVQSLISILKDGNDATAVVTVELAIGKCSGGCNRANHYCIHLAKREIPYELEIRLDYNEIHVQWKSREEFVPMMVWTGPSCNAPLNCTPVAAVSDQGQFGKTLTDRLDSFRFQLEKMGSCELVLERLDVLEG